MADTIIPPPAPAPTKVPSATEAPVSPPSAKTRTVPFHELYSLPAPIRTFPLPTFFPNNPISLAQLVWTWLRHTVFPPPAEPSTVHEGIWDPSSRSVHVKDPKSMRALWEQGFYGKGNLSRSEPNWFRREQIRRGVVEGNVSEERTTSRREERRAAKWERARLEREAIEQTLLEEQAQAARMIQKGDSPDSQPRPSLLPRKPPVGPLELLSLPNSLSDLPTDRNNTLNGFAADPKANDTPNGTLLPPPILQRDTLSTGSDRRILLTNGVNSGANGNGATYANGFPDGVNGTSEGSLTPSASPPHAEDPKDTAGMSRKESPNQHLKHRKSVRFSPTVESTTFQHSDPPNPSHSATSSKRAGGSSPPRLANGTVHNHPTAPSPVPEVQAATPSPQKPLDANDPVPNKEYLQLSPEEAFFLVFALGALSVKDPETNLPIPPDELLTRLRSHSHFPPRIEDSLSTSPAAIGSLSPDDPFLIHYAVYHHFRSMGWVPRHGIKFSVDWMLYQRGPVFDHAEFGVIVLPSFSDPWWKDHGHQAPQRTWRWLNGVNRVLSHVLKSLVLVYVDIPPPPVFNEALALKVPDGRKGGIAEALKHYRIREIMARRWSSNRNR